MSEDVGAVAADLKQALRQCCQLPFLLLWTCLARCEVSQVQMP